MAAPAFNHADPTESFRNDSYEDDPEPTTAWETVEESGMLRLRHYAPRTEQTGRLPVLIVYSLFKRPYVLDLTEERSIIRCLLDRGLNVYLVDWRPPGIEDSGRGLDAYVNEDLARAIDCIRRREHVRQVSMVGICFGGLLALIYAALHPESVGHLVPIAVSIEPRRIMPPMLIEQTVLMHGNIPAWWVHNVSNASVPIPPLVPQYLAKELEEPELAELHAGEYSPLCRKLEQWINSDRPFAGELACEIMRDIYWEGQLANGQLQVGGQTVSLDRIRCPVLNVSGTKDQLVPPQTTATLTDRVSSAYARNFMFPASHLGLIAGKHALEEMWPRIGMWLKVID